MSDLDEFSTPIGTGMHRVVDPPTMNPEREQKLRTRLDEFDRMRQRGAAEAAVTPFPVPEVSP